ncbi:MAG: DUF2269 family protein [Spirochaetales bacterium]|nr:DUF2269 family protein [Spirochaetales bacterium]
MKTRSLLFFALGVMGVLILLAALFPHLLVALLYQPGLYPHVLFAHILSTTLFFANAVVGILWEARSLATGRKEIIFHTYSTVAWLDARFSTVLIVLSVLTGISLGVTIGGIWQFGWLSSSFILFLISGVIWVISDIPTQYKVNRLKETEDPSSVGISDELRRVLKMRLGISLAGVAPLLVVFILMVYKPL